MARIRSIHPGLFTDESFAGLSMAARVLLLGLWTEADDQGVFDWKPITLKMRVMPVDNVDVPSLLLELEEADVIRQFRQDDRSFGAIRNFCKYQRPKTPKYRALRSGDIRNYVASKYKMEEMTEAEQPSFPQKVEISPQRKEEGGRRKEVEEVSRSKPTESALSRFEEFWKAFPRRDGPNPRKPAETKFNALVKTGIDPQMLIDEAIKLARNEAARGNIGTRFIPQAATWLSQQRWTDHAAVAIAQLIGQPLTIEEAVVQFARIGLWSRHAPISDISLAPAELLAKHGLSRDGRKLEAI